MLLSLGMAKVRFGTEMKKFREANLLTQMGLAMEMELTLRAYQYLEYGETLPTMKTKRAFIRVKRKFRRAAFHAAKVRNQQLAEIERSHAGK